MKKQATTRRIFTFVFIAAIIAGACWYLALFTPYNYFTAKWDILNGKVRFVTFGLPGTSPFQTKLDSIRNYYGVKSSNIGCVVTEDEIRGISFYNDVIEDYLEKQNGKGWRERYLQQLDSIRLGSRR